MKTEQMHLHDFVSLAEMPEDSACMLWVNSDELSFHPVELPDVPQRKLQKMLPWLLEDQLLAAPEDMHLVLMPAAGDEPDSLIAAPRDCMQRWLTLLGDRSPRVKALFPDVLALPWEPGCISLASQGTRWLVRTSLNSGFSGSQDFVGPILASRLAADEGLQLHCYGFDDAPLGLEVPAAQLFQRDAGINWATASTPAANLLTGEYRPASMHFSLGRWRPALAAGLCALALGLSWLALDYRDSGARLAEVNQALARDYQALFAGQAPALQGLRQAAETEIRRREQLYLAEQTSILPLMRQLDPLLSGCRDCMPGHISLSDQSAEIVLNADASAIAGLRQLDGWNVTDSPEAGQVRLQLEKAGP